MRSGFEVRASQDGDRALIDARGLLDAYTGLQLRDEVTARIEAGATQIQIDASQITFIDSGGLRVLVDTAHDLEKRGGRLSLVEPSETVTQVLEITALTARFGL